MGDSEADMKQIASTSQESFDQHIRPRMAELLAKTYAALKEYEALTECYPTSGELTAWLVEKGRAFDVNTVRPDLTRLKQAGRVRVAGKRACGVSGRKCFVWVAV
jgi:hypothetical protein